MRSPIHTLVMGPVLLAALAFTANSARAATTTLNVPFSFTAGGKICPAGAYIVQRDFDGNRVMLKSKDATRVFSWIAGAGVTDPSENHVVLKFDEAGQGHALRSIQYGSIVTSRLDRKFAATGHILSVNTGGQ